MRDIPEVKSNNIESGVGQEIVYSEDKMQNPLGQNPNDPGGEATTEQHWIAGTNNTTKQTPQQKFLSSSAPTLVGALLESAEEAEEPNIEMIDEVNCHLSRPNESEGIGGSHIDEILEHDWQEGHPHFKVHWSDNSTTWEHLKDMREDYPRMTAQYIVRKKVSRSKRGGDRILRWAKKVVRDLDRAVRRITHLYDLYLLR